MNASTQPTGEPVRYVVPGQFARITTGPGLFARPTTSTASKPAPAPTPAEITKNGEIAAARIKLRHAQKHLVQILEKYENA